MSVTVVRPQELGGSQQQLWRTWMRATPGLDTPFLSPEYVVALERSAAPVRVAVLEHDGEIAAFLPFEVLGPNRAGPPGPEVSDVTGLVHRPGLEWDPHALLRGAGLRSWQFGNLLGDQVPAAARYVVRERSPVIDFPDGYEAYLVGRRQSSKQLVQSTMRKRRKLEREVGELRFELAAVDPAALAELMAWKSAQYRAMGEWDRFADPAIAELVRTLAATGSESCSGVLSVLHAGDRLVAGHFGLRSSSTLCWWFPVYDPELARYSPGLQLLFRMVEDAADTELRRIDLGVGEHGYKDAMKTGEVLLARGLMDDGSPQALLGRARTAPRHHLRTLVRAHPRLLAIARRLRGSGQSGPPPA